MDTKMQDTMEAQFFNRDGSFPFHVYRIDAVGNADLVAPHWHKEIEIVVAEMDMLVYLDGKKVHYSAGDILTVTSRQVHATHPLAAGTCYHIVFGTKLLTTGYPIRKMEEIMCGQSMVRTLITPNDEPYEKLMGYVQAFLQEAEMENREIYQMRVLAGLFGYFADAAAMGYTENVKKQTDAKIGCYKEALRYLQEHFHESITMQDAADHLFISKSGFFHLFREYSGGTPTAYLNRLRLEEGRKLLLGGKNVTETAALVGMSDAAYFIRCFRKYYRITPKQYVKTANRKVWTGMEQRESNES